MIVSTTGATITAVGVTKEMVMTARTRTTTPAAISVAKTMARKTILEEVL